ncbi:hypothetical protein ACHAWT_001170, partial [Skeletonema menzelii]
AAAAAAFSVGNCLNEGGDAPSSLGSANDLWSCLPSTSTITIGPQRRYYKSEKYPLSILLSNNIAQKASVFDAYTTSFLEEISDWDKTHDDTPNHHHLLQGDGCPWAFREGGSLSSTALIGACVDAENGDCFSLRVIDERLLQQQQSNDGSASSCGAAMMKVVVVDDRNAAASLNCRERVDAVCFSGEYGVVTSHSIAVARNGAASNITATCLKWWDHRMLRSHQPVSSMCLSFPRDNVNLLSPDVERCLAGSFCDFWTNQDDAACSPASLRELSIQQPLDSTNFGMFQVNRLVGARDSSDRFAIHMKVGSNANHHHHDEVLMIDSCRGEITQQIRNANIGGLSLCMSSYLDTMACYTTKVDEKQCISIYDVSRHRSEGISNRDGPFEYLSGKKRQLQNDEVSNDDEMNDDGLLRR